MNDMKALECFHVFKEYSPEKKEPIIVRCLRIFFPSVIGDDITKEIRYYTHKHIHTEREQLKLQKQEIEKVGCCSKILIMNR